MRISRLLALALAGASGCSDSTGVADPVLVTTIQGTVQDSLAGKPAPGVIVSLGAQSDTTDFLGSYQINGVPSGDRTVTVNAAGFEAYVRPVTLNASTVHNVPLRRLAPFLRSFTGAANSRAITATYTDLQGAGTIDVAGSYATYAGSNSTFPSYTFVAALGTATSQQLDPLTLRISASAEIGMRTVSLSIRDREGNFRRTECIIGGACTEQPQ